MRGRASIRKSGEEDRRLEIELDPFVGPRVVEFKV